MPQNKFRLEFDTERMMRIFDIRIGRTEISDVLAEDFDYIDESLVDDIIEKYQISGTNKEDVMGIIDVYREGLVVEAVNDMAKENLKERLLMLDNLPYSYISPNGVPESGNARCFEQVFVTDKKVVIIANKDCGHIIYDSIPPHNKYGFYEGVVSGNINSSAFYNNIGVISDELDRRYEKLPEMQWVDVWKHVNDVVVDRWNDNNFKLRLKKARIKYGDKDYKKYWKELEKKNKKNILDVDDWPNLRVFDISIIHDDDAIKKLWIEGYEVAYVEGDKVFLVRKRYNNRWGDVSGEW